MIGGGDRVGDMPQVDLVLAHAVFRQNTGYGKVQRPRRRRDPLQKFGAFLHGSQREVGRAPWHHAVAGYRSNPGATIGRPFAVDQIELELAGDHWPDSSRSTLANDPPQHLARIKPQRFEGTDIPHHAHDLGKRCASPLHASQGSRERQGRAIRIAIRRPDSQRVVAEAATVGNGRRRRKLHTVLEDLIGVIDANALAEDRAVAVHDEGVDALDVRIGLPESRPVAQCRNTVPFITHDFPIGSSLLP